MVNTKPQRGRNGLLCAFSSIECEPEHKRRWVLLRCFVSHCLEVSFVDVSVALSRACPPPQCCCCRRFFCNTRIRTEEIAVVERFCCPAFCRRIPVVSSVPWASYHLLRLRLVLLAARPAPSLVSLKRY